MSRLHTRIFETDDAEAASRLLARRHAALRRAEPMFDPRFEEPRVARAEVEELLGQGAIGAVAACALEKSSGHRGMTRPAHAGFLGYASVFPHARRLGAGRALGEAALDWMRQEGFTSAVIDSTHRLLTVRLRRRRAGNFVNGHG